MFSLSTLIPEALKSRNSNPPKNKGNSTLAPVIQAFTRALLLLSPLFGSLHSASGQTLTTLVNFNFSNGAYPDTTLIQGSDGKFYGTTQVGGSCGNSTGCGTIFKMTPDGMLTTLVDFNITNGYIPHDGLIEGGDGYFYGTTQVGGGCNASLSAGCGTVFKMTADGTLSTLVNFDQVTNGGNLYAALTEGSDGNFYGTTGTGGGFSINYPGGYGSVFKMAPDGTLTTLVNFNGTNGQLPQSKLVQGSDGNFYGTTYYGGSSTNCDYNCGTIFRVTPDGNLTTLVNFDNYTNGFAPYAGLILGSDGNFYGTTVGGGILGYGTIFRMKPTGELTTLVNFNLTNGYGPAGRLVQASDGNFYGTNTYGGSSNNGTIFRMTPSGTITTLASFNITNGQYPFSGLIQDSDGNLYGSTLYGGSFNYGTIFRLSGALLPTFSTITNFTPNSGPSGTSVVITGTNFTGVTAVKFNSTPASFVVNSDTQITATVPNGATTGPITITSPAGSVSSTTNFAVAAAPTLSSFTPASGPIGTSVTITGANLSGAMAVKFNGVAVTSFTVNSSTKITAKVPNGATTGPISVTTPGGTAISATAFVVSPKINSFTPANGPVGSAVTITGNTLTGATSVAFNGVPATSFTVNSATKITATVPAGASTGLITVTTPNGTATSTTVYTVTVPPLTLSSFTPTSGPIATSVTLTGSGFIGATSVTFNGVAATSLTVNSDTKITTKVPNGVTSGPIVVTTPAGTVTSSNPFLVTPKINSFTPASGPVGTVVTLTGNTFTGATGVTFNGVPAIVFSVKSATKITATVPVGTTTGLITVTTPSGSGSSTTAYTVTP
jgi:uncharacterized repeat protein (TIGR03803 family)